jgi:hypothetical protein
LKEREPEKLAVCNFLGSFSRMRKNIAFQALRCEDTTYQN